MTPGRARAVNVAISLLLLLALALIVDIGETARLLASADPTLIAAALAVNMAANVIAARRFRLSLVVHGRSLPFRDVLRVHFIALLFNQTLPTGLGGDAYKVIALRRHGRAVRMIRAVLLDRVYGLAMLLLCATLAAPWLASKLPTFDQGLVAAAIGPLGLAAMVLAASVPSSWLRRLPRLLRIFAGGVANLRHTVQGTLKWRFLRTGIGFTAASIVSYVLTAMAFGSAIPVAVLAAGVPLVFVIMQFPLSFAGWGPREASAVFLFSGLESSDALSFAIALAFGLVMTATALPGAAFLIAGDSARGSRA